MLIHVYSLLSFICGRNCLTTISQDCMTSDYKYQTPSLVKKIFVLEKWADTSPSIFCRELNPWLYFISAVPSCSISLNWRINKKQQAMNSEFLKFLCPLVWKQQFVVCWLVRLCPVGIPWISSVFSFQYLCHKRAPCAALRHRAYLFYAAVWKTLSVTELVQVSHPAESISVSLLRSLHSFYSA